MVVFSKYTVYYNIWIVSSAHYSPCYFWNILITSKHFQNMLWHVQAHRSPLQFSCLKYPQSHFHHQVYMHVQLPLQTSITLLLSLATTQILNALKNNNNNKKKQTKNTPHLAYFKYALLKIISPLVNHQWFLHCIVAMTPTFEVAWSKEPWPDLEKHFHWEWTYCLSKGYSHCVRGAAHITAV